MSNPLIINRLTTGIPGLDEVLGGGIPELSFNLIAGEPGCGKTTLAHQMMFALATPERPALYFTVLGEPALKMLRYQQQFTFFQNDAVNRAVYFISLADDALTGDLEKVLCRIAAEVRAYKPAFVFVDSFRTALLASRPVGDPYNHLQQFVQRLGTLATSWQVTAFLVGEYFCNSEHEPVFSVADGLIKLQQSVQRNSMVRKIEILKMRGQPTLAGLHTFRINGSGIEIFPPATFVMLAGGDASPPTSTDRVMTGTPGLDAMLGGGLPRGFSVLIAGPSGSGKSILARAFLEEGARCGETGIIAAFEQHPNRSRNPAIIALIKSGKVSLVDGRAPDLSIEEILQLIIREIKRLKATRVVIDSLSGFELTVAPTFRADFRESLSRLVIALAGTGVTVVVTSELEDRYTDLRFSPYGTAFLTDAIIVQRYIEIESRLRRVMAVVKVRASAHSNELREYTINDNGIQIGEMLPAQQGLLVGVPRLREPAAPAEPDKSALILDLPA